MELSNDLDVTLGQVLGGLRFSTAVGVAAALGVTADELRTMALDGLDVNQLRALCVAMGKGAGVGISYEDAADELAEKARGVAYVLQQMACAKDPDDEQGAAFAMLASTLDAAVDGVERARCA